MQLFVKAASLGLSVLLVCSTALGYYESHRNFPSKRGFSKSIPSKKGNLFFKDEAPPPVTVAPSHEGVTFECEAGGSPQPTIHWLKDGERIEQGVFDNSIEEETSFEDKTDKRGQRLLRLGSTKGKLFLDCLGQESEGTYSCVAETPYKRISRSSELQIDNVANTLPMGIDTQRCLVKRSMKDGEPARIYLWTANRIEMEGADVQLFCRATGYPKPVITWVDIEGNLVQKGDDRYKILSNGDLLIHKISWKKNLGVYNCIATNPTGTDKTETFLYPTTP
ncbi:zwei Ig domain protein zig-4-like [Liolophura sinensis]|uniref:zwei Ig domain protein zig-4-like n=1 Tax=Liolophura sinensis TaxID=3198878 RepID=UPI0031592C22